MKLIAGGEQIYVTHTSNQKLNEGILKNYMHASDVEVGARGNSQ